MSGSPAREGAVWVPPEQGLPTGLMAAVRRRAKWTRALALPAVDRGWLGLTPLETHVVICGLPRSGSTLLLLMAERCVGNARTFGTEVWAIEAARYALRNHRVMVTKRPNDVFEVERLRAFYADRPARVRFVVTMRDPRAVLTSRHARARPDEYYVEPERWLAIDAAVENLRESEDVLVVDMVDLVDRPGEVQRQLTAHIGWTVHHPFARFDEVNGGAFRDTAALGGVRPLDRTRLDRWRAPEHRERIRALLRLVPRLPERLIELGYETERAWVDDYA